MMIPQYVQGGIAPKLITNKALFGIIFATSAGWLEHVIIYGYIYIYMVSPLRNDGWIPLKAHWNHCKMTPSTNKLGGLWWSRKLQGRLKVSATQQTCADRGESQSRHRNGDVEGVLRCIFIIITDGDVEWCIIYIYIYKYMLDIHWRSIYDDSWIQLIGMYIDSI